MNGRKNMTNSSKVPRKAGGRVPVPVIVLAVHGILAFSLWMLAFVVKWFPYGKLAGVRDWLFRFL